MSSEKPLYTALAGTGLLSTPLLNKGSAFSRQERIDFNLMGLLPCRYETIDEQVARCYRQYASFSADINKHIYLRALQDFNETLYYRLIEKYIDEMLPIIYTPTVGQACERFSEIYRHHRGLFISYADRDQMDDILHNATRHKVKIIVVTDGERILGLGDQGIGGMGIPIGKLSLYTGCGGISPAYTLPVTLDVGTNNQRLLEDPMYMGLRQRRIDKQEYDEFLDIFMSAAQRRWPGVMIQFEDFAQQNATPLLKRYRHRYSCFNDDIQGTAAVACGTLLAACQSQKQRVRDQVVAFVGGGSAGCGIAEQVIRQMVMEGLEEEQARARVFVVDRLGLLTDQTPGLRDFQSKLAQRQGALTGWSYCGDYPDLLDVVQQARPTVLIGVSGQAGIFSQPIISAMSANCERPIVFPLSNPSRQIEATPADVINWSEGRAIVATGSPFDPVNYNGRNYPIAQCNNSYIFPGIGLGVLACGARSISDGMMMAASTTLAQCSPCLTDEGSSLLLPALKELPALSRKIAFAVARAAMSEGLAMEVSAARLEALISENFWKPDYRAYRRASA